MNQQPDLPNNTDSAQDNGLEKRLFAMNHTFPYPPTPDIASAVRGRLNQLKQLNRGARHMPAFPARRLLWAAIIALLVLAGLLAVPQVRAAILEWLQIGGVRIFLTEPTPTATPSGTFAPAPTQTLIVSLRTLAGRTTLVEAQKRLTFPIRLPAYPPDLGQPDDVFLQQLGGPYLVLVWLDKTQPADVKLSLHVFGPGTFADKIQPKVIQETRVNGGPAYWTEGLYMLQLQGVSGSDFGERRLIAGHVLIWKEGRLTYRLETGASLDEAVRMAESLR